MSPASRGRREKRSQKPRPGGHGRRTGPQFRGLGRDAEDAGRYAVGADPALLADPLATRDLLARRRFAIPDPIAVVDGEHMEIDPADEDERELAIVAEHPEYRDVLDDPLSDELVDGVNPRLHIALHQILANQLWDDDPPEVWQAARRLLGQGHDRHTVLHGLADELAVELHPVLTGGQAPDPEMAAYRARLRAL